MLSGNVFGETIKYPTSLIVRGAEPIGIELAKSLLDQGGFVIMADSADRESMSVIGELKKYKLFRFIELSEIDQLSEPLRRLDYVFYLSHTFEGLSSEISSKGFLDYSRFLDEVLKLSKQFDSKFLGTASIKAHQLNVANKLMDVDTMSENKVYTTAEIQRYTESLVTEYIQKDSLDARIVRLGELLGEGIEYTPNTTLGRIIKEAIGDNEITIYGDGLESEYYVHLQDAVYGLIKAQFSKNTRGEVFSLAYEYEISALSIAYKMNDFLEMPKEIKFSSKNVDDFAFKLYKPAPNLMRIGWKPRISFERALKQTFEYAKKYFSLDIQPVVEQKKSNIISNIFFEKETPQIKESDINEYGALGRLIAERKSRDNDRHGSIVLANEHLAKRVKKESKATLVDKSVNKIRKSFDSFTRQYRWIKNLTIRQFIFYTIGFILFGYLYINVFSVALSFGRNMLLFYNSVEKTNQAIVDDNRVQILDNIKFANEQTDLAMGKVDSFYFLNGWSSYDKFSKEMKSIFGSFESLNSSIIGTVESSNTIYEYLSKFDPQVVYRPNSKSLLSVQNNITLNQDYETIKLSNFNFAENLAKLTQRVEFLNTLPYESFGLKGTVVELGMNKYKDSLTVFIDKHSDYLKASKILENLVKSERSKSFVFVLMDNAYFLPSGGNPVGLVYVDINNGGIENIKIGSMDNNDYKMETISDYALEQINLVSPSTVTNETLTINDLLLVHNGDFYLNILARDFSIKEGKRIDGVFMISTDVLSDMLGIVGASEYNNIKFDSSSLMSNLDLLAKESDNPIVYRREIISNIFAVSIRDLLNNLNTKLFEIVPIVENSIANKSITYRLFMDGVPNTNSDDLLTRTPDYLSIGVKASDDGTQMRTAPKYKISVSTLIKDDLSTRKTVDVDLSEVNNLEYAMVCVPVGSSNFTFNELADNNKFIRFGEEQTCIRFGSGVGQNFQLSYDSISIISASESSLRYMLGIRQQPGAVVELNSNFTTENLLFQQDDSTTKDDRIEKVDYNKVLTGDKVFSFDLIKQQ
jgi:UDP-glucuronate decarboxylase